MSGGNSSKGGNGKGEDEGKDWDSKFFEVAAAATATAVVAGGLYALLKPSGSGHHPEPEVAFEARRVRGGADDPWSSPRRYHGNSLGWSFPPEEEDDDDDNSIACNFPPDGWIICNVDGSAPPDKASGCGGVFRDSTGSWKYGFARSFDRCTSSAAELKGIYTGLDIALKQGFRKLVLVTDSLTAANVVNNNNGASARRPKEKKLVQSIRNLLENRNWDVKPKIVHIKVDSNKVAEWLANLSHGLEVGDQMELPKLPDGCRSCQKLVLEDKARLPKAKAGRSNLLI